MIAERAAGNPFFAEEIVRDLAERRVLRGNRSAYESTADAAEVSVPATLQSTIAARIDRLDPAANAHRAQRLSSVRGSAAASNPGYRSSPRGVGEGRLRRSDHI